MGVYASRVLTVSIGEWFTIIIVVRSNLFNQFCFSLKYQKKLGYIGLLFFRRCQTNVLKHFWIIKHQFDLKCLDNNINLLAFKSFELTLLSL